MSRSQKSVQTEHTENGLRSNSAAGGKAIEFASVMNRGSPPRIPCGQNLHLPPYIGWDRSKSTDYSDFFGPDLCDACGIRRCSAILPRPTADNGSKCRMGAERGGAKAEKPGSEKAKKSERRRDERRDEEHFREATAMKRRGQWGSTTIQGALGAVLDDDFLLAAYKASHFRNAHPTALGNFWLLRFVASQLLCSPSPPRQ
jgi:hypothetical protein